MDIDKLRTAYGEACLLVDVLESDKSPAQVEARQKMYELEDQLPEEWRMIHFDYRASGMFTRKHWQEFAKEWYNCAEPRKQKMIQMEWDHAATHGRFIAIEQPEEAWTSK